MSLLQVDNVTLRFGGLTAVDAVSFAVPAGSITAVIGPNGAGKTSLFNVITGLYPPTSGRVLLANRELVRLATPATWSGWITSGLVTGCAATVAINAASWWNLTINDLAGHTPFSWSEATSILASQFTPSAWNLVPLLIGIALGSAGAWQVWRHNRRSSDLAFRNGIARTFQNIRLFRGMTCIDNILIALSSAGHLRGAGPLGAVLRTPRFRRIEAAARREGERLLAVVGLADTAKRLAGDLPYGHQRRLEIARALAGSPKLLLLDEPAAGMNESESAALMTLIREIRDRGVTVLLIEHDMRVVMGISDRVVVLQYGKKIAEGRPDEVRADAKVIEAYLGSEVAS